MIELIALVGHSLGVLLLGGLGLFFVAGWLRIFFEGYRAYSAARWMHQSRQVCGEYVRWYLTGAKMLRIWWLFIWSPRGHVSYMKGDGYWRDYDDWELPSPEEGDPNEDPPPTTEYVKDP